MSRLYDRLMRSNVITVEEREVLQGCPVIDISDVISFYYLHERSVWDLNNPQEFPNLAPPFPLFFLEGKLSNRMRDPDGVIRYTDLPNYLGCIIRSDINKKTNTWDCTYQFLIERNKDNIKSNFIVDVIVNSQGGTTQTPKIWLPSSLVGSAKEEIAAGFGALYLVPAALAVCLLHCKNVTLNEVSPSNKPNQKHLKKYGVPMTKYYTLDIEPMKQTLRTEGNSESEGLQKALHICRGHFKDFRDGKGLFGKYKDVYWWDSQVRGTTKRGEVMKDYKIKI